MFGFASQPGVLSAVFGILCVSCVLYYVWVACQVRSLLCLVFCVFHVFCVVFGFACLMRTLCSAVFGLASSVVGSCVLGGRGGLGSSGGAN